MLIALGANLSQGCLSPAATLERALDLLAESPGIAVAARSSWWRSAAVPAGSGPDFVNGAARVAGADSPEDLLARLHAVEDRLGRSRPSRWAPRVCDLDLVAAGGAIRPDHQTLTRWMALPAEAARTETPETLLLPHPRMQERAFVLAPLAEIDPDWRHPLLGLTPLEMLARLPAADRAGTVPLAEDG